MRLITLIRVNVFLEERLHLRVVVRLPAKTGGASWLFAAHSCLQRRSLDDHLLTPVKPLTLGEQLLLTVASAQAHLRRATTTVVHPDVTGDLSILLRSVQCLPAFLSSQ